MTQCEEVSDSSTAGHNMRAALPVDGFGDDPPRSFFYVDGWVAIK